MVNNERGYIMSDRATGQNTDVPRHLSKQEFGRKLHRLMLDKGMRQIDLANAAGLPRNSVSTYVRGLSYPSQGSLIAMAKVLDMDPEALLPNVTEAAIRQEEMPDVSLKSSIGDPGKSWLIINRLVSTAVGAKVVAMLEEDRAAND